MCNKIEGVELLKPTEVKKILNCSLSWVYKAANRGLLPCVRLPSCMAGKKKWLIRFKKSDVLAFIENHHTGKKR